MKFRLIFKQAVKDFRNKIQLYFSFIIFIVISIGLIFGLFSFNFTFQQAYQEVINSASSTHEFIRNFQFVSSNAAKWGGELGFTNNYTRYQIEDESAPFTKYIFQDILLKEFQIDEKGSFYRSFDDEEMELMWNDLGFKNAGSELNLNTYFNFNVINILGMNGGFSYFDSLKIYQQILKLSDNDLGQIFNNNGEIVNGLVNNPNYLRYAAYEKINFYVRRNNRWFSNDPKDQFYDQNLQFNSNVLNKFIYEKKVVEANQENSALKKAGYSVNFGFSPYFQSSWHQLDGHPGTKVAEILMPAEEWMDENFDWIGNKDLLNPKTWNKKAGLWDHSPEFAKLGGLNGLKIYDRLSVDQINALDPEILANGTYGYITPRFLKANKLKIGDKLSYYTSQYNSGYKTITIIGTAISRRAFFSNDVQTPLFVPFQHLIQRNNFTNFYMNSFNFPQLKQFDFDQANRLIKTYFYNDFQKKYLENSPITNFLPLEKLDFEVGNASAIVSIFNLVITMIAIMTLLLLFVVFYFITDQSIKMQREILWFLKSLGEKNFNLSLITTLSGIVPILIGTILGVIASFGVSQMMNAIISGGFPFYFPPLSFHPRALVLLIGTIFLIFFGFLLMNFLFIRSKRTLTMQNYQKINFSTKLYIKSKPLFKYFKPQTRIGISFIAKNLFKNLITFLLLVISFSILLFSVQFQSSSKTSAQAFENRHKPYKSVAINKQNSSDAVSLNSLYMKDLLPNFDDQMQKPEMLTLYNEFKKLAYYQGPKTTYKEAVGEEIVYRDVETNQVIDLIPILTTSTQTGDQQLNQLIKNQINELFKNLEKKIKNPFAEITFNSEYDLTNYYLDKSYMVELLKDPEDQEKHVDQIFAFSESEVETYAEQIIFIMESFEKICGQKILPEVSNDELNIFGQSLFENIVNTAKTEFSKEIVELRNAGIVMKSNFADFDFNLNIYFNRNVLSPGNEQKKVFANNMLIEGYLTTGIGLDSRQSETYQMITSPFNSLKLNNNNFSQFHDYYDVGKREWIKVKAIDGYISKALAKRLKIHRNQVIEVLMPSFSFGEGVIPTVYFKVKGIIEEANYLREVYYNKIDLFNYLKVMLEDKFKAERGTELKVQPLNQDLEQRSDYKFLTSAIDKLTNPNNPNAADLFNNSTYSLAELPYGISNFSLHAKMGTGYSLLSYTYLPMFNYGSQNYQVNLANGIYVFRAITEILLSVLAPLNSALEQFIILLGLIALAVGSILITLILFENKNIILLFKSLGYKKRQVNLYLTSGYIVSTLLALVVGGLVSYFGINIASDILLDQLEMSLIFIWSAPFILFGIIASIGFIGSTLISTTIYTNKQEPKYAFANL